MKVIALKGDVREGLGKSATKKVRSEGKVPCVIYGKGENHHFSVYQADFKNLIYTPNTYLVQVTVGDTVKLAKVQELQYHPVSEDILHADFYEVDAATPISIAVPVKVVGNSPGVIAGGKLQLKIKKLNVLGLIGDLPEFIDVPEKIIASETYDDSTGSSTGDWVEESITFETGSSSEIVFFMTNDFTASDQSYYDDFTIVKN